MTDYDSLLTEFQRNAEEEIRALLKRHGRSLESRDVRRGVIPIYSSEPQTVVYLRAGDFETWLFDDEASFTSAGGGGSVEQVDFGSQAGLLERLLEQIQAALQKQSAT